MQLNRKVSLVCFLLCLTLTDAEIVEHKLEGLSGIIVSPNYPENYPEFLNVTWEINVKKGFAVQLYFTEFDVEDSYDVDLGGSCVYDYVQIKDGDRLDHKYCGNSKFKQFNAPKILKKIRSSQNKIVINFVSDYSNEEPIPKGFHIHWKAIDKDECWELKAKAQRAVEDWDSVLYCNQHCHNVPSTYYCSCDVGFKLHENKHTCTSDCAGRILTDSEGEITTSRYPKAYSKLAKCDWTIQQKEGISIELQFIDTFGIEKHVDEGCVYDWVQYEDAYGVKSEKFCGSNLPAEGEWVFTNSHMIKVYFVSDLTMENSGFKLRYKTTRVACFKAPVAPDNGEITSTIKDYVFEDLVTFKCNIGYRLIGKSTIECLSTGKWSAEEPKCEIKSCKHPSHLDNIKNGKIKEKKITLTYGSEVTFLCIVWYEMTSGTSVWKCDDDETWHEASQPVAKNKFNNRPECQPICGLKGNKKILSGTYDFGDVIPDVEDKELAVSSHIHGGVESLEAEWPWVVLVDTYGFGPKYMTTFCGGSIVSPNIVITAAHCLEITIKSNILVYAGITLREKVIRKHVQIFGVTEIFEHPHYGNESSFENDIALLKLNKSIDIGKYARPICMPRSNREISLPEKALSEEEGYQKTGVIAGWGLTESGSTSAHLMESRVPPIDHNLCKKEVYNEVYNLKASDNMICAGYLSGKKDSCKGDSGGPYMFRDTARGKWFLNGIVSFGSSDRSCGNKTFGLYTKVSSYVEWVENFITD